MRAAAIRIPHVTGRRQFWIVVILTLSRSVRALDLVQNSCTNKGCNYRCSVCEHNTLIVSCPNHTTIQVQSGFYGRTLPYSRVCHTDRGTSKTDCTNPPSEAILKSHCDGKQKCTLIANNDDMGGDPCGGTSKYIEMNYTCVGNQIASGESDMCWKESGEHRCIVCQDSQMKINCSQEEVMIIESAFYGRREPYSQFCPERGCHQVEEDTSCEATSSNEKIKFNCHHRQSCTLKAKNNVFGNPCGNTQKYIDVRYKCMDCTDRLCMRKKRLLELEDNIRAVLQNIKKPGKSYSKRSISAKSFNHSKDEKPSLSSGEAKLALNKLYSEADFAMGLGLLNVSLQEKESFVNDSSQFTDPGNGNIFATEIFPLLAVVVSKLSTGLPTKAAVSYTLPLPETKTLRDFTMLKQTDESQVRYRGFQWVCAFIDFDTASFSNEGCQPTPTVVGSNMTCECNHTTIFTILLAVDAVTLPPNVKLFSFIAGGVSVFFLIITISTLYVIRKHVFSDRIFIQINLCISLLVFHVLNLTHDASVLNPQLCEGLAVCLHYFLLSSVFWMLVEGITLAMKTSSKVLQFSAIKSSTINAARALVGWGIPAVITSITAVLGFAFFPPYLQQSALYVAGFGTTKYDRCALTYRSPFFYYTVIGPICFCAAVNLAILGHVAAFTLRLRLSTPRPRHSMSDTEVAKRILFPEVVHVAKTMLLLIPVTGVPLVLGVFIGIGSTESSMFFMYTHLAVNGLQGFFIFLVYCVMSAEVRHGLKNVVCRGQIC